MTTRIELNKRVVEVYTSPESWTKDKVYIYDPQLEVTEEERSQIIDYSYPKGSSKIGDSV